MSNLSEFNEYIGNLLSDPYKEDNWSHLEEFIRKKDEIEDLEAVKEKLMGAVEFFKSAGYWEYAARAIENLIPLESDPSVQAKLNLELGKIYDDEIYNARKARRAYEEVLRLKQGDEEASELLSRLRSLSDGWRDVVERYLQEAEDTEEGHYKSRLYLQVASLYQKFGGKAKERLKDVLHYLQLSLETDYSNTKAVEFLRRILIEKKNWDELLSLYKRLGEVATTKQEKVKALEQQAMILVKMNRNEEAAEIYNQVISLVPGHKQAMSFLVNYYTETGDSDKLIEIYENVLKSRPSKQDELATMLQIAMVFWRMKGELEKAADYFKKIRRAIPAHPAALNFYRHYYESMGDWGKLVQVLADTVRKVKEREECIKLYREIADISENKLNNVERAIDAYKAILKIAPDDREALSALKERYRKTQKWNALLDLLKSEAASASDVGKKIELLKEIATIYSSKLSLDVMVLKTYHQILGLNPKDEEAMATLVEMYEKNGKWNDLAALYQKRVSVEEDKEKKIEQLKKIAEIWMVKLSNFNRAVKPLEQILELDPRDREVVASLKNIYRQRRMWEPLFRIMVGERQELSGEGLISHLKEMARLAWEKLGKVNEAADLYWEILEAEKDNVEIMKNLEKICERKKDWEGLAKVLEMQAGFVDSPDARLSLLLKWGNIVSERLNKPDVAERIWKEVISIRPAHPKAIAALKSIYIESRNWNKLTELYAESGNWEGLAEVFLSTAEKIDDPSQKIELFFKAGEIYGEKVNNPAKVLRCYEKVLSVDPENRKASTALLPIYEKEGNYRKLIEVLNSLLKTDETDEEKIRRMNYLINVYGKELSDYNSAFATALEAFKINSDDKEVLSALENYGEKTSSWDKLIEVYREKIGSASEDEKLLFQKKLANCLYTKVGRVDEALSIYEVVHEAYPDDVEVNGAIEEILNTTGNLEKLIKFYEERLDKEEDRDSKVNLLRRMAKIAHEGLDDSEMASRFYRQILDYEPADREAIEELITLYRIGGKWEELAATFSIKKEVTEGDELVDTALELAEIYMENLGKYDEAMAEIEFALQQRPADRKAVSLLEKFLPKEEKRIEAARLIKPHLLPLEKYSTYAWVLQILLEDSKDPEERRNLYISLAEVYEKNLSDVDVAFETILKAVEEFPLSDRVYGTVEELAQKTSNWEVALKRLEDIFHREETDDETKVVIARRIARVSEQELGDMQKAEKFYGWIFHKFNEDEESFSHLEIIYTNMDDYEKLKGIYRLKADVTSDPGLKVEFLHKIGFIYEDMLEDRQSAIEIYREILSLRSESESARKALERLYEQEGMWQELAELLEATMQYLSPENVTTAKYRLAEVLSAKLKRYDKAIECYREVLEEHPTHLKAQEALEKMLQVDEVKYQAAEILEPIYDAQGAYGQLISVLRVRYEGEASVEGKIETLLKMADVQEKRLRDWDGSFETLSLAFSLDPSRSETIDRIESVVAERDLWEVYVEVIEEALPKIEGDVGVKASMLFKVAQIYDEKVGDMQKAEEIYKRFLELSYDDSEKILLAARCLERYYTESERYEDLIEVLRLQVRWSEDVEEQYNLLKRIAEIQETMLSAFGDAIRTNNDILDLKPDDRDAMFALKRLYHNREMWEELVSIIKRIIESSDDPVEKENLNYEMAKIYSEKLENYEEAIFIYQLIIEEFGEDKRPYELLLELYSKTGDYSELVSTATKLVELAESEGEEEEMVSRLLYRGRVEEEKLRDLDAAADTYRKVVSIDESNDEAIKRLENLLSEEDVRVKVAQILEPIYEKVQDYEKLISVIDIQVSEEADLEKKISLQRKAAEVAEIGLGDFGKAFYYYCEALRGRLAEPEKAYPIIDELERIVKDTGDHQRLVDFYGQIAPDIMDDELRLKVYITIAETYYREIGNLESARDWYTSVLDISPGNEEAISSLEEIYTKLEDFPKLIEILKMKVEVVEDPTLKVEILFRQAKLSEEKLDDADSAIEAYESILNIEESRDAVKALENLYASTGRWGNYRDILERQLEWPDVDATNLHHKLGVTLYENLGDPDSALEHFKQSLAIRQDYKPTIEVLEKLLEDTTFRQQVAEILEPIYLRNFQFDKLLALMEVKLESIADPVERREIFNKMGKIYEEQFEDLGKAFDVYVRLFKEDIENRDARQKIDRLAGVLDVWPKAAQAYKEILEEQVSDTPASAELWHHLGSVLDGYCDDLEGAIEAYRKALEFDPSDKRYFSALENLFKRDDKWAQELFDLYRSGVDSQVEVGQRKRMLHDMAKLSEEKLNQPRQAIEIWREVLAEDPEDQVAVSSLERLYFYEGMYRELADLLIERIDAARNAMEQIELKNRLATIYYKYLDDRESAIDLYEQILNQDSAYQDSIDALETMLGDEQYEQRVAEILVPVYKERKNWQKLIRAYQSELKYITEPTERKHRFAEIGKLYEEVIGDMSEAFSAYSSAFKEDPADSTLLEKVMDMAEKVGKWDSLARVLDEAASITDMVSVKATLLRWEARTLDRRVGDFRSAVEVYKRLLEVEEGDSEALESLDSLLTLLSDWEELLKCLDIKANYTMSQDALLGLRRRQGEICEEGLGDIERAISYYNQALEVDPSDMQTFAALERLYEESEKWEELAEVLRYRIGYLTDNLEKRRVMLRLAEVQKDKLNNIEEAILVYNSILEDFPEDIEVMKILDRLLSSEHRWEEYYENLNRRAKITFDEEQLVEIMLKMGDVLLNKIGEMERAIETYSKILEIKESEEACEALEAMAENEDYRHQVISILEPIYRKGGNWEKLLKLFRLRLDILSDPNERAKALVQIAELQQQGMGQKDSAFNTYLEALKEETWREEIYRRAEILAEELGKYAEFAQHLEQKVSSIFDVELIAGLNLRIGAIWETKVGDKQRAIQCYKKVLDQGVDETQALAALERLYTEAEEWEHLLEVLERKAVVERDMMAKSELLLTMADIRMNKTGDIEGAVRSTSEVLREFPDNQMAVEILETLLDRGEVVDEIVEVLIDAYRRTENLRKLVDILDLKARRVESPEEKVEVLKEEAEVAEEGLKDPDTAMKALLSALWEVPDDRALLDEVERLSEILGAWESLSAHLSRIVEERDVYDDTKKEMCLRVARYYKDKLREPRMAAKWYEEFIKLEPDNNEVLKEYEEELYKISDYEKLLGVLERREELEYDASERRKVLYAIAEVSLRETREKSRAIRAYEKLLEIDDSNVEVIDEIIKLKWDEDWEGVIEMLERRIDCTDDEAESNQFRFKLAEVFISVKEDEERAIDLYNEILNYDPANEEAGKRLEELYRKSERWDELKQLWLKEIDMVKTDEQRFEMFMKLADLLKDKLDDNEGAIEYLMRAYEIDPSSASVVSSLEGLLKECGRTEELIELLRERGEKIKESAPESYLAILVRIGEIYFRSLGSPEMAMEYYEKVLEKDPENGLALSALCDIYYSEGQYQKCISLLDRIAGATKDLKEMGEVFYRIGVIKKEKLSDMEGALEAFNAVLEVYPEHPKILDELLDYYKARGDWDRYVNTLELKLQEMGDGDEKVMLLTQLGKISREKLEDYNRSLSFFESAYEIKPDDIELQKSLVTAYLEAGIIDKATPMIENLIASEKNKGVKKSKELATYLHLLGQVYEKRGDTEAAISKYEEANRMDHSSFVIRYSLGKLYKQKGEIDRAMGLLRPLLLQNLEPYGIDKAGIYFMVAQMYMEKGEKDKAINMIDRGLSVRPDDEMKKLLDELRKK